MKKMFAQITLSCNFKIVIPSYIYIYMIAINYWNVPFINLCLKDGVVQSLSWTKIIKPDERWGGFPQA